MTTDPIGTAQERELIEAVRNIARSMHCDADEDWLETAADALQSRIAEVADLKHDLERQMTIANTYVNEVVRLETALQRAERFIRDLATTDTMIMADTLEAEADALSLSLQRRPT